MMMNLSTLKDTPPWDWPEGAGKKLLDILRDDRATEFELLLAAELASDFTVIDDELADALVSVLKRADKSEKIRGQAAISLGPVLEQADTEGFEDPDDIPIAEPTFHRIQESLRQLYLDASVPEEVRRRILEASVRAPQDWHKDAVSTAFSSGDEVWRLTAVFCMRFVRGFDAQILEALESKNPDIHYEQFSPRATGKSTQPGRMSRRTSPQETRTSPCFWRRSRRSPASVHTRWQRFSRTSLTPTTKTSSRPSTRRWR
jgi:hypothetical protein